MPFLLTALDRQRFVLWSTAVAMVFRGALNFALIPAFGYVGPCMAFCASEVLLLALMGVCLARCGYRLPLLQTSWRPLIAAGCMLLVVWPCRNSPLAMALPAAAAGLLVYGLALWRLGTFSADEVELAREASRFIKPLIEKWSRQPEHTAV